MQKKYIITAAVFILIVASIADTISFRKNGGHSGNSIIESSDKAARDVAEAWIKNSVSTYIFDGANLAFIENSKSDCAGCFIFNFSFESRHGGYGNREGLFVTQAVTPHTIEVEVKNGKVTRAITDGKYNELTGALAE